LLNSTTSRKLKQTPFGIVDQYAIVIDVFKPTLTLRSIENSIVLNDHGSGLAFK